MMNIDIGWTILMKDKNRWKVEAVVGGWQSAVSGRQSAFSGQWSAVSDQV